MQIITKQWVYKGQKIAGVYRFTHEAQEYEVIKNENGTEWELYKLDEYAPQEWIHSAKTKKQLLNDFIQMS